MSLGKTHTSHEGGGQLCRGICLCAWGAKYRQAFFFNTRLVDMVANEWNVGLFAI